MKILLLVDCFYPSTKSAPKLIADLAHELSEQGHTVTIATADATLKPNRDITQHEAYTLVRVRTARIKGASKPLRAFHESRLSTVFWKRCKDYFIENPCDLIVFYSPSIFFGKLVSKLKTLWNAKTYLVLRDLFPQWAIDAGILKEGMISRYFRKKEIQQYQVADKIGVQSPANLDYFKERGWHKKYQLEVLYNWMRITEQGAQETNYREQLGLQDKVVFFFGGNMGLAQDLENIVCLARNMRNNPKAFFLLVGDGDQVSNLKKSIQILKLNNIKILPAVDQDKYLGMLMEFDIGLICLDKKLKTQNFPGKMLGYMLNSKPMLASVNPGNDLVDLIQGESIGCACINGDDGLLLQQAEELANDRLRRKQLGENARRVLETKFSTKNAVDLIIE